MNYNSMELEIVGITCINTFAHLQRVDKIIIFTIQKKISHIIKAHFLRFQYINFFKLFI